LVVDDDATSVNRAMEFLDPFAQHRSQPERFAQVAVYPVSEEAAVRWQDIAKRRSQGEHHIVRSLPAHGERAPEDGFELVVCFSGVGAHVFDSAARMLPYVQDLVEEGVYVA
jgi:hypothetical protein